MSMGFKIMGYQAIEATLCDECDIDGKTDIQTFITLQKV
jgi:hypothetical protein